MVDLHEVVFRWPYGGEDVIVTGTFDQWSSSVHLSKTPSGFEGVVRVPWSQKILYKFIVDGRWRTTDQAPTEDDGFGNTNNIYHTPNKPLSPSIVNESPMVAVIRANESQIDKPSSSEVQDVSELTNGSTVVPVKESQEGKTPGSVVADKEDVAVVTKGPKNEQPIVQDEVVPPVAEKLTEELLVPHVEPKTEVETVELAIPLPGPEAKATEPPTASRSDAPKFSMPVVPVNDGTLVSEQFVASPDASQPDSALSTHTPVVNSRRSASMSSPVAYQREKIDGSNDQNGNNDTATSPSVPATPQKQPFPSSAKPDSPVSQKTGSLRSSKRDSIKGSGSRPKRDSIFGKLKTMFSPDKDKEKQKVLKK